MASHGLTLGLLLGGLDYGNQRIAGGATEREWWGSIRVTEGAFSGPTQGATGYFFHLREMANGGGSRLTGYRYENGVRREDFGGASGSAGVVLAIREVGLEPFDFAAEVADTVARDDLMLPFVLDGAEYEIAIHTSTGVFELRAWNPEPTIHAIAPHSEKIAKLKAVLDLLAQYYGRTRFGV
jgi:hypothetical protein